LGRFCPGSALAAFKNKKHNKIAAMANRKVIELLKRYAVLQTPERNMVAGHTCLVAL